MIRDIVRAALAIAVMAAAAGLLVEVRFQLASIDIAHRAATVPQPTPWAAHQPAGYPAQTVEPGPLRRVGRAALDLADAAIGVVR